MVLAVLFLFATGLRAQDSNGRSHSDSGSTGSTQASAATGKISGKVVDAETGETIIGANVGVVGTSRGDATDINGKYAISGLQPGIYALQVSYVTHTRKTITGIEVNNGEVTTVNVALQQKTFGLEEITVTARVNSSGEAGLLSLQKKATAVQDGLSREMLSKTGDSDVADAMKRVTGVTVQNGQDVYVRGLGNRYSNVQLNGAQVPSTNPNRKEAPIDLFGSGLIDNIVVQKTYTPDQSAEFSGGSVQITTREFPDSRSLTFGYSTSYNTVSTFDNMLSGPGSSTDFLGFDDGKRSLPSLLKDRRVSDDIAPQVAEALHNEWNLGNRRQAVPPQSFSMDYANQFNEDSLPIGIVGNLSYKYNREMRPDLTSRFIQFFNNRRPDYRTDYRVDEGLEEADLSAMLNLFMKPSPVTKIGLKSLYSNSTTKSNKVIEGPYQNGVNRMTVSEFDRRNIFSTSLEVDTYFEQFLSSRLTGSLSYNRALRVRPDRRTTRYNLTGGVYRFRAFGDNNGHFFSDQEDHNYAGELKYRFTPADVVEVSLGGSATVKDRRFTARRIAYRDNVAPFASDMATLSPGEVLDDGNVGNGVLEMVEFTQFGLNQSDWYDGFQTVYAGYATTKWGAIDRLSFEIGARVENSVQTIEVPESLGGAYVEAAEVNNTDFLPAVNLTWELTSTTNLRAAYSRTLARPEFREIANFNFADYFGGQRIYGNPDLKRTRITNYDLRVETYPNPGEVFAVSAFFKHFENPIEIFYRLTDANEVFYDNAPEADLFGIELEGRKNVTERLQLVANFSYILSESRMDPDASNRVPNLERPMVGQSPYVVNASAFYSIPSWNMDLSLSYNTFGERIVTVGKREQQYDEYEQPFHSLGAKVDYKLGLVGLSLEASNLLGDDTVYKQGPATTFRYSPGRTFKMGIKLSL